MKDRRSTETVNSRELTVIGDPAKFAALGIDFTEDSAQEAELVTQSVKSHPRRRYPGGPTTSVAGHTRQKSVGGEKEGTNALPGKPFYIEVTTGSGVTKKVTATRFSYIGRWTDLKTKILMDLAPSPNIRLRNASGKSIPLAVAPE
jgi:hypothetical protein